MSNIFFNAQHSPIGAFASFTLGFPGPKGGLGLELGKPADQDVYIGIQADDSNVYRTLPFHTVDIGDSEARRFDILAEQDHAGSGKQPIKLVPFNSSDIVREYSLGMDTWRAGGLAFRIYTPMQLVPDPENAVGEQLRQALVPALLVEMRIDSTGGRTTRRAFFGYRGNDPYTGMRKLDDTAEGLAGVGQARHTAIASRDPGVWSALGFTIEDILSIDANGETAFGLGNVGALCVDVPAGEVRTYVARYGGEEFVVIAPETDREERSRWQSVCGVRSKVSPGRFVR